MQLETVTQKRKEKKDNHVYEQRFKPCWITSACLSLLYRSVWLSSDPAWPDHIIQFITTQSYVGPEPQRCSLMWVLNIVSPRGNDALCNRQPQLSRNVEKIYSHTWMSKLGTKVRLKAAQK